MTAGDVKAASSPGVRPAIFVRELPSAVGLQLGLNVVGRVRALVAWGAVAALEIDDVTIGAVDEVMREAGGGEAGAHARRQHNLAAVGDQSRRAFEHVDELVLLAVQVQKR